MVKEVLKAIDNAVINGKTDAERLAELRARVEAVNRPEAVSQELPADIQAIVNDFNGLRLVDILSLQDGIGKLDAKDVRVFKSKKDVAMYGLVDSFRTVAYAKIGKRTLLAKISLTVV